MTASLEIAPLHQAEPEDALAGGVEPSEHTGATAAAANLDVSQATREVVREVVVKPDGITFEPHAVRLVEGVARIQPVEAVGIARHDLGIAYNLSERQLPVDRHNLHVYTADAKLRRLAEHATDVAMGSPNVRKGTQLVPAEAAIVFGALRQRAADIGNNDTLGMRQLTAAVVATWGNTAKTSR